MTKLIHSVKTKLSLVLFLGLCCPALAQTFILQWVNVDASGNILQVGYNNQIQGLEVNAFAPTSPAKTVYLGGVFNGVFGYYYAGTQWGVGRYVNGGNLVAVPLYGLPAYPGGLTANNAFKLVYTPPPGDYFTAYALTDGPYHVNGVNGRVRALALSANGDLYLGGDFTNPGGNSYSDYIGCYRASGGWQTTHYFCAWSIVTGLSWYNSHKLYVSGSSSPYLTSITGPIYAGDYSPDTLSTPNHYVYWNTDSNGAFENGYFSNY